MVAYEVISQLEKQGLFDLAVKAGVISITQAGHKLIYEVFLKYKGEGLNTRKAVIQTSIETDTPESNIWYIKKRMES